MNTCTHDIQAIALFFLTILAPLNFDLSGASFFSIKEVKADDSTENATTPASPPLSIISLTDIAGNSTNIDLTKPEIIVLEWFNQECPFVKKIYKNNFVQNLKKEYQAKGVRWITINSTNPAHPDFVSVDKRAELAEKFSLDFDSTYFDESGIFGKAIGAKTTPHFFVLKKAEVLYQGSFDDAADTDSDPANAKNYVREALDSIIAGENPKVRKNRPYGCSIKYSK